MTQEIIDSSPVITDIDQNEPHTYTDINNVPVAWRTYKSIRLSLKQINEIMADAYANAIETETGLIPNYGVARANFAEAHHVEEGFWVGGSK